MTQIVLILIFLKTKSRKYHFGDGKAKVIEYKLQEKSCDYSLVL